MTQNYWTDRRVTRRRVVGGAAVGGLAFAALGGIACSSSNNTASKPATSAAQTSSPATAAVAPAQGTPAGSPQAGLSPAGVKPDQIRAMSKEQLRERFHGKQLKNLPGWKNGPRSGGVLVVGTTPGSVTDTPPSWDPTGPAGGNLADQRVAHDQLLEWDTHELTDNPNFPKLTGELAAGLPEQPDPLTYIFKLRPGVKFQDVAPVNGRALVANDVKVSIEALQKAPAQAGYYADVESVTVVDDATVSIKMKQPAAYFLEQIASNENWIFAPEQMANDGLAKRPIGTGPFIFDSGEPGKGHKWHKNPNYWKTDHWTGKKLPYLDGIEMKTFGDPAAQRAAYVSGQIHFAPALQRPEDIAQLLQDKPDTVPFIWQPWSAYQPHLGIRLDQAPWNDERVRQALSLTIDRDTIIKTVFGGLGEYGYGLSYAWFGREFSWNKDELQPYITYDPAKAKQLMTAAGFANGIGRSVELFTPFSVGGYFDTYTLVADNWKKTLGLDVKLNITPDQPTFFKSFYGKTYKDLAGGGFGIGFTDIEPDAFIYTASYSQSKGNYYFVNDPELDRLALTQRKTLDRTERQKVIQQWKDRDLNLVTRLFTVGQYFPAARAANYYGAIPNTVGANPFGWGSHISRTHWLSS